MLLNVDLPISEPWPSSPTTATASRTCSAAFTRRYRDLANAEVRAEHEVVIVARDSRRRSCS